MNRERRLAFFCVCVALLALAGCSLLSSHSIPTPDPPSALAIGLVGEVMRFEVALLSCARGHEALIQWDWGEGGELSDWSTSFGLTHSWSSPGRYEVRVRVRCAVDDSVVSSWSDAFQVDILEMPTPG